MPLEHASYDEEFYYWLIAQEGRADPVGDLAAELRRTSVPLLENFRTHVRELRGGRQAYCEWLDYAWQARQPN